MNEKRETICRLYDEFIDLLVEIGRLISLMGIFIW
jgi:hypothetical protein